MVEVSRHVVTAVNPRLALYTRAGFLAVLVLLMNYGVVAGVALFLMGSCTRITTVQTSEPETSGGWAVMENFVNKTLAKEGIVTEGPVTVTTNVSGCAKRSVRTIVAPFPDQTFRVYYGSTKLPIWEGTGVTVDIPCWNEAIPCSSNSAFDGDFDSMSEDNLPCGMYGSVYYDWPSTPTPWMANLAPKFDRFPWCSEEEEQESRRKFNQLRTVPSDLYPGINVTLAETCGSRWGVAPAGITTTPLSHVDADHDVEFRTLTPFTTYWDLNITTTTETCPTFAAAFSNALAISAQVEIVITVALIYTFQKAGIIKLADGVVDMGVEGAAGVIRKSKLKELAQMEDGSSTIVV